MTDAEIKPHFSQLKYASDRRELGKADHYWRGQFLRGWQGFTRGGFTAEPIVELTWTNLGIHMAKKFGAQSKSQIYDVIEILDAFERK